MAGLAFARASAADDPAGYLVSASDGAPVTSAHGTCLRTSEWSPDSAYRGCGPVPFTVATDALFAFGSAVLTADAAQALDALARHLAQASYHSVDIAGHADALGRPGYNRRLSAQRAKTVRDYLVARGVDRSKVTLSALGSENSLTAELCAGFKGEELIACMQPDRYAGVTVKGSDMR
jgi:OOP family OmpA-OmpF porin